MRKFPDESKSHQNQNIPYWRERTLNFNRSMHETSRIKPARMSERFAKPSKSFYIPFKSQSNMVRRSYSNSEVNSSLYKPESENYLMQPLIEQTNKCHQARSESVKTQLKRNKLESEIAGFTIEHEKSKRNILSKLPKITTIIDSPLLTYREDAETAESAKLLSSSSDQILKLMNERDMLKHKIFFDRTSKELEIRELEKDLSKLKDDLSKEQRIAKDKVAKLDEELSMTKIRLEEELIQKKDLVSKINTLQVELDRKENECENKSEKLNSIENADKNLSSICYQLNREVEGLESQLKLNEEKNKRLESDFNLVIQKNECLSSQLAKLNQDLDASNQCNMLIKRNYEDQIAKYMNIESSHKEEIQKLEERVKLKEEQFERFQRELELALTPKLEERIKQEKMVLEQKNAEIKHELNRLNEERLSEIEHLQMLLVQEKEKVAIGKEIVLKQEKKIEELNHIVKLSNREKQTVLTKARDSFKADIQKLKTELNNEKQEELNRQRRLIKELEEELQIRNDEHKKEREKNLEIIASVEKFEKNLIKEINEEQRKLASICFIPKFIKYSNNPKSNSLVSLETLQSIFANFKGILQDIIQKYQELSGENEKLKRSMNKIVQEKDEEIETVKRQFERQKQKELEKLREYISNDQNNLSNYTSEMSNLVEALKSKDNEIRAIQENMSDWKKETLNKLASKFEIELNQELDKRMEIYKFNTNDQQVQLEKLRKQMEQVFKDSNASQQSAQDDNIRMIEYLQSRLNDLRNENLGLREKLTKSSIAIPSVSMLIIDDNNRRNETSILNSSEPKDIDGDLITDFNDDLVQQKIKDLQTLQMQLSNVNS